MVARWLRWDWAGARAHWREDARRGFLFGLGISGAVAAWLGRA